MSRAVVQQPKGWQFQSRSTRVSRCVFGVQTIPALPHMNVSHYLVVAGGTICGRLVATAATHVAYHHHCECGVNK